MASRSRQIESRAALTATANGNAITQSSEYVSLFVDVTAASGTSPTLDLTVEWSPDGTTWATPDVGADSFTQITTTGTTVKRFTALGLYYRVVMTVGGTTPSFTFTIHEFATT